MVDREVAERMGRCDRGQREQGDGADGKRQCASKPHGRGSGADVVASIGRVYGDIPIVTGGRVSGQSRVRDARPGAGARASLDIVPPLHSVGWRVLRGGGEEPVRGRFVTLEGPEGCGKTTQATRLAELADAAGLSCVLTREPGGTIVGERIWELLLDTSPGVAIDPRADALLFNAARAQLVHEVIEPALEQGSLVVCARYADSTVAYQGAGRGLSESALRDLATFATEGLDPDLTILLDVAPEIGLARKAAEDRTRFEAGYDLAFHRRVRDCFLAVAAAQPERIAVVDASGSTDDVFAAVLRAMRRLPDVAAGLQMASEVDAGDPGFGSHRR